MPRGFIALLTGKMASRGQRAVALEIPVPNISGEDREVEKLKYRERSSILVMTSIFLAWLITALLSKSLRGRGKYLDG